MEAELDEFAPCEEELYVVSNRAVLFIGQLQSPGLKAMVLWCS